MVFVFGCVFDMVGLAVVVNVIGFSFLVFVVVFLDKFIFSFGTAVVIFNS